MMKIILILVSLVNTAGYTQNRPFVKELQSALAREDTASSYQSVIKSAKQMQQIAERYPREWLASYWTAHVYSQCAVFSLSSEEREKYSDYLDLAKSHYDRSWAANKSKSKADESDFYVLEANTLGLRIGQYSYERNWEKVGEYAELRDRALLKARQANPNNPMVWTLEGINKLRDESTREEGGEILAQAIKLYERYPPASPIHPRWGRQWIDFWLERYSLAENDK